MKYIIIDWSRRSSNENTISILKFIDDNEKYLKNKFLMFLNEIENEKIFNETLSSVTNKRGYNFWIISQIYEKSFYKSSLNIDFLKIAALEEILKNDYRKIKIKNAPKRFYKSIKYLCDLKKVSFNFEDINQKINNKFKFPYFMTAISYLIINYLRAIIVRLHTKKISKKQNSKISVFSYFYNFKIKKESNEIHFEQWKEIPIKIKSIFKTEINWFHHYISHNNIRKISTSAKLIQKLNIEQKDLHSLIIINLDLINFIKILLNFFYLTVFSNYRKFKNLLFINHHYRKIYWNIFKNDWNESFHGKVLMQNLIWIEIFESIISKLPRQDLGFYLFENQSWEKILIHAWRRNGHKEIVGFLPNLTRYWDLRYSYHSNKANFNSLMPDKIICLDLNSYSNLLEIGFGRKDIIREISSYNPNSFGDKILSKQNDNDDKKIIIFGDYEKKINYDFFNILQKIKNINKFKLYLKCHPSNRINTNNFNAIKLQIIQDEIIDFTKFNNAIVIGATGIALNLYLRNLNLLIFYNEDDLNYSPLKDFKDISFACNLKALENYFLSISFKKNNSVHKRVFFNRNEQDNWNFI